jgi:membrane protein YqaA with SNARE-associated domain
MEESPQNTDSTENVETATRPVPAWHLHRRLYDWVLHWADTAYGGWALFVMSFAESSFFPIPPDVLLMPLVLGNRRKWSRFALMCSIASIVGGIVGYGIGMFLWDQTGDFFHDHIPGFARDQVVMIDGTEHEGMFARKDVSVSGPMMKGAVSYPASLATADGSSITLSDTDVAEVHVNPFTRVGALYAKYSFWIVFAAGFTPLPYKVITITAGVFGINFPIFLIASAISRSARFFLVAGMMGIFGPAIKPFIDKYFNLLCIAFVLLLIGGFAAIKLIG